jgi:hypothetical protein
VSKWNSPLPTHCQLCSRPLSQQFVDGKTVMGPWAIMCAICHWKHGVGEGIGKGQRYDLTTREKMGVEP